jgi:hypothetical protein
VPSRSYIGIGFGESRPLGPFDAILKTIREIKRILLEHTLPVRHRERIVSDPAVVVTTNSAEP